MDLPVRVRFAPSPTGPLHIGGLRTALFNYLFAKKNKGSFILRIEDTDQNRFVLGAEEYIIKALEWAGIPYDEGPGKEGSYGPYRQSNRKELYRQYADMLLENGSAYLAFDTQEQLEKLRQTHQRSGKTFMYNAKAREELHTSLSMSKVQIKELQEAGSEYVIRLKTPEKSTLIYNDLIRGEIQIETDQLDDKILFKSDGMPTYHLAHLVDDHLMEISHVIRGEEWLPSLPTHLLLYEAFGWNPPQFAHLPLILKPSGSGKLSKRDGETGGFPVYPIEWRDKETNRKSSGFREEGYFPDALVNFLAFIGWNPGTEKELFSITELCESFSLERVHKAGARFDPEKAKWYNHHYLQMKSNEELARSFELLLESKGIKSSPNLLGIVDALKERATFVADFWDQGSYFFVAPTKYDEKEVARVWKNNAPLHFREVLEHLKLSTHWQAAALQDQIKTWLEEKNLGFGKLMPALRLSLVGELKGPEVALIMELLGKEESLRRLEYTLAVLG